MTEKIPMVIPSTVSTVRSRFTRIAEMANKKLSFMSRRNNMTQIYELLHNAQCTLHNGQRTMRRAQSTTHNAQSTMRITLLLLRNTGLFQGLF